MTKKFNPKIYQGKDRIYCSINRAPRVSRLYVWNSERKEYEVPLYGKVYMAKRYENISPEMSARKVRFFATLEEARDWQSKASDLIPSPTQTLNFQKAHPVIPPESVIGKSEPTFGEIVSKWKKRKLANMQSTSQVRYETLLRLYFTDLYSVPLRSITPQVVDNWLDQLKEPENWTMQSKKRKNFRYELSLLSSVLKYYVDYHDDPHFTFPIKQRHKEAIKLNRPKHTMPKDLTTEEFFKFRDSLLKYKYGEVLAVLATVQYFQALRISEAAGLFFEDALLDFKNPSASRLKVVRAVKWVRKGGVPPALDMSFKNSESNQGVKEQPIFPETFKALKSIWKIGVKGLIFHNHGELFTYRQIQSAYDQAFIKADLPYRGTHVMRHGGCRNIYNQVPDLNVAQQLLGNSDLKSTLVYAKRSASALTDVSNGEWKKLDDIGCKWLHEDSAQKKV